MFIYKLILLSYMVNITKISSRGQIVIPQEIREKLQLEEGNLILISDQDNAICLKKIDTLKVLRKLAGDGRKIFDEI